MQNMTNEQYKSSLRAIKAHAEETQSIQKVIALIDIMTGDNIKQTSNEGKTKEKTGEPLKK